MRGSVLAAAMWLAFPSATVRAQTIRGVVVDAADRPISGVVMLLLDDAATIKGRALTNELGEFRLTGPAGTYRIRTTRIGFRPLLSEPTTLAANEVVIQRLRLSGLPFSLDTIHAESKTSCRMAARDSAVATWRVWEQVRAALTATDLTASTRGVTAMTMSYDRTIELIHRRIIQQSANIRSEVVRQPWRTIPPDSLRRAGYVSTGSGEFTTYFAPGLDVLQSDSFLEDHCLWLATGDPTRLGVDFEPTSDRRKVAEIRGTVWLDRKSSELRSLDFRYVNVSRDVENNAGGEMQFARMRNGAWAISRWSIRMPVFAQVEDARGRGYSTRMTEIHVSGGELVLATSLASRGKDTLWARPPLVLLGSVLDSLSGAPVPNARLSLSGTSLEGVTDAAGHFAVAGVLPGHYTVQVRTPSLDSVNSVNETPIVFTDSAASMTIRVPTGGQVATKLCGNQLPTALGIIIGLAGLRGDSVPRPDIRVAVEWADISMAHAVVERTPRVSDARTDSTGTFKICGVPVNTTLSIRAIVDNATSAPALIRIPSDARFAHVSLVIDPRAVAAVIFFGVVADSGRQPLSNAVVLIQDLGRKDVTPVDGAFYLPDVNPGTHHVIVRHVGYAPLDTTIAFGSSARFYKMFYLRRITTLDSVAVNAPAPRDLGMEGFAEHKARGFGHFITRGELQRMDNLTLKSVVEQVPGVGLARGPNNQGWVAGRRNPSALCRVPPVTRADTLCLTSRGYYLPDRTERLQGIAMNCYSSVYMDRRVMNLGYPTAPFDLSTVPVGQIEAVEWYTDSAETPPEYSGHGAGCGVMIIHTRRPP